MLIHFPTRKLFLTLAIILTSVHVGGFPTIFKLERVSNHATELSELRDRDILRNSQLRSFNFPVYGTSDIYLAGLFYTKIALGSPSKEYYVMIDTGSDFLWVSCNSCNNCPRSSAYNISLEFYDPSNSTTASLISCSDRRCSLIGQHSDSRCTHSSNQCSYTYPYADGSQTSGYYVSDLMHLSTHGVASDASAHVVFGCSISQAGNLVDPSITVGGILGLGPRGLSIIRQLSAQKITPNVFSHCLIGNKSGGGSLVIGQIVEPNMVYTPLVPSQSYYTISLQSISVNGQRLSIDPSTFAISGDNGGTIIDSGTTLTYLPESAFHPFVDAITQTVSQSTRPIISKEAYCYLITSSVSKIFPTVSFNFAGGAIMSLRPEDYLLREFSVNGTEKWCVGFGISKYGGKTILGELVLKNKLVVYDIDCQRIGWKNHDCSSPVKVSSTSSCGRNTSGDRKRKSNSNSLRYKLLLLIPIIVVLCYHNIKGM